MTRHVLRTSFGFLAAAAIAAPVVAWADDQVKESDSVRIQSRTESRTSAAGTDRAGQQTIEGKLVDLHQFMTGSSASGTGGQVHQMWALETSSGLVLLSDPHSTPAASAQP